MEGARQCSGNTQNFGAIGHESSPTVMTVLGPISPRELGTTLLHEHLIFDLRFGDPDPNKFMDESDAAIQDMLLLREAGGQTLVEQTCQGIGRNPAALREIAGQCDVHIIASTGFYRMTTYPSYVRSESVEDLAERLIRDITEGINGTEVRAGMIAEIATEGNTAFTGTQIKVYRAVALAQQATGLSISAHCWLGKGAVPLIHLLTADGVAADRIVVHHIGANRMTPQAALLILDAGAKIMVDCIGYGEADGFIGWNDRDRAALVGTLFARGYGQQVTISKDLCRRSHFTKFGGHGHRYLLRGFIPMLREVGLTQGHIEGLLVGIPREVLTPKL